MATTTKKTATEQAAEFLADARRHGFTVEPIRHPEVVTIALSFEPGDRDAYVAADGVAWSVLSGAPMLYPGTTWGTDGASVGGHAGLTGGYYRLSKSGVSRRFVKALAKLL